MSFVDLVRGVQNEANCSQHACMCMSATIGIALFIIGCVGAAGALSGVGIGGCAIGLSIPMALASFCGGIEGEKRAREVLANVIYALVMTIIGALAIAGTISPIVMGWCVIAPSLVHIAMSYCMTYCCCR